MARTALAVTLLVMLSMNASAQPVTPETMARPLVFEENCGQFAADVAFAARMGGGVSLFTPDGVTFHPVHRSDSDVCDRPADSVALRFGGSSVSVPRGIDRTRQRTNYYLGRDEDHWITGVPNYRRIRYEQLYPGIDVEFYEAAAGLEFDVIVAPGADPSPLRLVWEGIDSLAMTDRGVEASAGSLAMRLLPPTVYQPDGSHPIAAQYARSSENELRIELGAYDSAHPLVIDPVITFSTYIGGSDTSDHIRAVKTDRVGNVYVGGHIFSTSFFGVIRSERQSDPFIMKLTTAGEIEFLTVFGSPMNVVEYFDDLAIDGAGNSYAIGITGGPDFPLRNPVQSSLTGETDGFIVKLDPSGAMLYSTYLGGSASDGFPSRMAVDRDGSIVVAKWTRSADLPLVNPIHSVRRGTDDVYLAKLSPEGDRILFSTYLGGTASSGATNEFPSSLLIDDAGDIFVVGQTLSPDFPLHNAMQEEHKGGLDLFITKIRSDGSRILFSTLLGGSAHDGGIFSARPGTLDHDGNLVLAFRTSSPDLPLVEAPLPDPTSFYLARMRGDGTALQLGTYLPAPPGFAPAVDSRILGVGAASTGAIYLAGKTDSPELPLVAPIQEYSGGESNAFVMKLNRSGTVAFSTYLGGSGNEYLYSMAVYPGGGVALAGATGSPDFPLVNPIQAELNGDYDEWVMILRDSDLIVDDQRILPVVGSLAGGHGSFFRTTTQIHNPFDEPVSARIAFRRAGTTSETVAPPLDIFLAPGQTRSFADLLPAMGHSGLGSADVLTTVRVPLAVARIFNDGGGAGTTGMSMDALRIDDALEAGQTGYLIAPADLTRARFNIGIRSLHEGAALDFIVRAGDGSQIAAFQRQFDPDFFVQQTSTDFFGFDLAGNESIAVHTVAGHAIVYGSTTDNTTQDPSLQIAWPRSDATRRILAVVGSTPGQFDSFFRTSLQLHNPGDISSEGRIVFHTIETSGSDNDPSLTFVLAPGQTLSYADLLPEMERSGIGSADVITTAGPSPIVISRIFNDAGEAGTTGMTQQAIPLSAALQEGDSGILIAPPDPGAARFNIGIRTLAAGATVSIRVRNAAGSEIWSKSLAFPPEYFQQKTSSTFLGIALAANDSVAFTIESGSAIIYGSTTDNITQDPSVQFVRSSW